MMIAGLVVFLLILGMFLHTLTSAPRSETEYQSDTDEDIPATSGPVKKDSHPVAA